MTYFERQFAAASLWRMHGHFIWVIPNQHFKSTLLGGGEGEGVTKKSTLCTLVKMMTILDDPLADMI